MSAIPEADPDEPIETKPFNWYVHSGTRFFPAGLDKSPIRPCHARCPRLPESTDRGYHIGYDARFPYQNQTKHCWQNYVDYHKCILAKGEDFRPCRQFFLAYRSMCPKSWTDRWDDQREAGNFPTRLE
ncbi:uncharacterized protein TRUGW13939_08659 [Talaromyces rugulosus]|uniref:Cytochrome c oxidase subunit 12, mitochondrial n=1 Tax=Talaromyces rugulosus TaxID=121627 RepID=A0A7H8R6D3_TALRU|nr:uncharacterized protein TRUGW13939_08659 [Talaromyces rugulosus]QKX61508.1 hypothetical protein TRUGW13939_08659 [Talaromyces rugulosus]